MCIKYNRVTKVRSRQAVKLRCGLTHCYVYARTGAQGLSIKNVINIWKYKKIKNLKVYVL